MSWLRQLPLIGKINGLITEQKPQSIRFDDFSNEERIWFFMLLTGATGGSLSFDELVDIEIVRDESAGVVSCLKILQSVGWRGA